MPDWTAADLPSFAGRTAIVTGANGGLGEVTARELARVGAKVILAVRNTEKGEAAAQQMRGDVEVRRLDLQDLSSVRDFAGGVDTVDVLVNNAGIMATALRADRRRLSSATCSTNHLGHFGRPFALTNLLLPKLTDRVVTVSSLMHMFGYISRKDLNGAWQFRPFEVAGLQPVETRQPAHLHRRWPRTAELAPGADRRLFLRALAAHPGVGQDTTCKANPAAKWVTRRSWPPPMLCPPMPTSAPGKRYTRYRRIYRATRSSAPDSACGAAPNRPGAPGWPSEQPLPPHSGSCPNSSPVPSFRSEERIS